MILILLCPPVRVQQIPYKSKVRAVKYLFGVSVGRWLRNPGRKGKLLSCSTPQTNNTEPQNHPTHSNFSPSSDVTRALRLAHEHPQPPPPGFVSVFAEATPGSRVRGPASALNGLQVITVARSAAVKMSLYPSLEDLKVDKVIQAQTSFASNPANPAILCEASAPILQDGNLYPKLYPEISQYMGISLNDEEIQRNLTMVPANSQGLVARPSASDYMVAPVTGNDVGIRRAEIKQGIRELILCKDQEGKIGLRLKSVDNGVFVQLVQANSPAALAGLRFGDQILQINGENCAGWSSDKAHKILKQIPGERISMIIRDRPFERTITMHKDSTGHVGFIFKNGKITSIVKDSSAARNGLLTEHSICEINGQNVIGLKDSQIADILSTAGNVVTITIMPSQIFEHIIKRMASNIMKSLMDHTIPEV